MRICIFQLKDPTPFLQRLQFTYTSPIPVEAKRMETTEARRLVGAENTGLFQYLNRHLYTPVKTTLPPFSQELQFTYIHFFTTGVSRRHARIRVFEYKSLYSPIKNTPFTLLSTATSCLYEFLFLFESTDVTITEARKQVKDDTSLFEYVNNSTCILQPKPLSRHFSSCRNHGPDHCKRTQICES